MIIKKMFFYGLMLLFLPFSISYANVFSQQSTQDLFSPSNAHQEFLAAENAFRVSVIENNDTKLVLSFISADGYYLYRDKFNFKVSPAKLATGEVILPKGVLKHDEFFSETEVYYGIINVEIGFNNPQNLPFSIDIGYQGCAEKGLCYPPQKVSFTFGSEPANSNIGQLQDLLNAEPYLPAHKITDDLLVLFLFFLGGLGLVFTPCVLPMLPIVSALVVRQHQASVWRKLWLALAYVLSMALCFALLGALMGMFGARLNLQARLQSAWFLVPFALFFTILALAMLGKFELQLPQFIRGPLENISNKASNGSFASSIVLGFLSALLVSPCVSAPLAAGLLYISLTGDALGGALRLLTLGLGMGLPLVVVSVGGAFLLPKSGSWMLGVRNFFAVLLLGVAVWLVERVIPSVLILPLWMVLAAYVMYLLWDKNLLCKLQKKQVLRICAISLLLAYCITATVGIYRGGSNVLRPWAGKPLIGQWQNFTDVKEFEQALQQANESHTPVLIDWYADWCISCKIMERNVFADEQVLPRLANYLLLRMDVTKANKEQRELLSKYNLFGPPAVLFFAPNGKNLEFLNIVGEINAAQFALKLDIFDAHLNLKK